MSRASTLPALPSEIELPPARQLANRVVMQASWSDPDDLSPLRRQARQVKGFRTWCVLRRMATQANSGISLEHIMAADKLREAVDVARFGYSGGRDPWVFLVTAAQPRSGPSPGEIKRAQAARNLLRVMRLFNPEQKRMLFAIVLDNWTIQAWVRTRTTETGRRFDRNVEKGRFLGLLDLLVQHFSTELEDEVQRGQRLPA